MKKTITFAVFVSVLILAFISAVSACTSQNPSCRDSVIITGVIYEENTNNSIADADVNVTCHHKKGNNTIDTSLQTTSNSTGEYIVYFDDKDCRKGDSVNVSATSNGITGEASGIVIKEKINHIRCRIAHIDVPLIPEFGLLVGSLTLISAAGIFFLVRRK